jgi:hypothetical protein
MTTTPNENLEGFARDCYARFTKSYIPGCIRYWMWDHGLVSEAIKARYENAVYDVITAMILVGITDEEDNQ